MIKFSEIFYTENEVEYIKKAMENRYLHGNEMFSKKVCNNLEKRFNIKKVMLTPSCTSALEMVGLLLGLKAEDEVIMPSYTFVSTANAFLLYGAKIKFVDVNPDTMNVSIEEIKKAVTNKTKAIVVVNYGGMSIDFDDLKLFLKERDIVLIEDNAQGIGAKYKDKYLGSFGDFSCVSFHDTKNVTSGGEGGALFINNEKFIKRAEIIREKGTNRLDFINGKVEKYTWKDLGSSFLMSELNSAFLLAQLEKLDKINSYRKMIWEYYYEELESLENKSLLKRQKKLNNIETNGHLFFVKLNTKDELIKLESYLKAKGIESATHYMPLHLSEAGIKFSEFVGEDKFTSVESKKLLRLPLHNNLTLGNVKYIISEIKKYFKG